MDSTFYVIMFVCMRAVYLQTIFEKEMCSEPQLRDVKRQLLDTQYIGDVNDLQRDVKGYGKKLQPVRMMFGVSSIVPNTNIDGNDLHDCVK